MAFLRPTAAQLISRIASDIESRLEGADAKLRRTVEGVFARVLGGAAHGMHGHIQHESKQIIPSVENDSEVIDRHGDFWLGINGRKDAVPSTGLLQFLGTASTPIPIDTVVQRADGVQYDTDIADVIGGGGFVDIQVTALVAAADGDAAAFSETTLVSPIAGVNDTQFFGATGASGGLDTESDEGLVGRIELRVQSAPKGGADGDYIQEMLTVAGVTRGFEFPLQAGPGTVVLYFVRDDESPIIPDAGELATVAAVIELFRPVTAIVSVLAPVAVTFTPSISLKVATGFTQSEVEANVTQQLADLLIRRGGVQDTLLLSQINESISLAAGEDDHVLTSPVANVTHAVGEIPVLGTPVYSVLP